MKRTLTTTVQRRLNALRSEALDLFEGLKSGTVTPKEGKRANQKLATALRRTRSFVEQELARRAQRDFVARGGESK